MRARFDTLTARKRAVFRLVHAGKPTRRIAAELDISERTVKGHRAQAMEKMQVASLAVMVRAADRLREYAESSCSAAVPLTDY